MTLYYEQIRLEKYNKSFFFISSKATYIMDCESAREDMTFKIYGLCWANDHTLIVTDKESGVYKYTIDIGEKTCTGERIDSGYIPNDVSCTKDGKVYITEQTEYNVSVLVRIYNLKTDTTEIWRPNITSDFPKITCNDNKIIISSYHESFVYTNNHKFLYKITHSQIERHLLHTYLSPTDIFWGCTAFRNNLLIINLLTNETKIYEHVDAYGVSGTQEGHVFITGDFGVSKVYNSSGVFLHRFYKTIPERGVLNLNDAILSKDGQIYMAFTVYNASFPLVIYSMGT